MVIAFESHVTSWQFDGRTVSSCVRLGEFPSAETMVGVLQHEGHLCAQLRRKLKLHTSWQDHKPVKRTIRIHDYLRERT